MAEKLSIEGTVNLQSLFGATPFSNTGSNQPNLNNNKNKRKLSAEEKASTDSESDHDSDDARDTAKGKKARAIRSGIADEDRRAHIAAVEHRTREEMRARKKQREAEEKATVFVGNWPIAQGENVLRRQFAPYGKVVSVRFRSMAFTLNEETKHLPKKAKAIMGAVEADLKPFCNAYVRFESPESVERALAANGAMVDGHRIRVDRVDRPAQYDPKRSVFVGNLPRTATEDAVWSHFEGVGPVEAVRIVRDKLTQAGKGIAYVLFKTSKDANAAVASLNDTDFEDRSIRVERIVADHKEKQEEEKKRKREEQEQESKSRAKKPKHENSARKERRRAAAAARDEQDVADGKTSSRPKYENTPSMRTPSKPSSSAADDDSKKKKPRQENSARKMRRQQMFSDTTTTTTSSSANATGAAASKPRTPNKGKPGTASPAAPVAKKPFQGLVAEKGVVPTVGKPRPKFEHNPNAAGRNSNKSGGTGGGSGAGHFGKNKPSRKHSEAKQWSKTMKKEEKFKAKKRAQQDGGAKKGGKHKGK